MGHRRARQRRRADAAGSKALYVPDGPKSVQDARRFCRVWLLFRDAHHRLDAVCSFGLLQTEGACRRE